MHLLVSLTHGTYLSHITIFFTTCGSTWNVVIKVLCSLKTLVCNYYSETCSFDIAPSHTHAYDCENNTFNIKNNSDFSLDSIQKNHSSWLIFEVEKCAKIPTVILFLIRQTRGHERCSKSGKSKLDIYLDEVPSLLYQRLLWVNKFWPMSENH